jgi:hypothetical protein
MLGHFIEVDKPLFAMKGVDYEYDYLSDGGSPSIEGEDIVILLNR